MSPGGISGRGEPSGCRSCSLRRATAPARQIEEWIRAGRLTVDGRVVELGERADPGADIRLDGARWNPGAAATRGKC